MRTLLIAALLIAAAAPAHAAPLKLTAAHCTLDGAALTVGQVTDGLAIAPDGAVLVIDGDGNLRRYVAAKGKGCALRLDRGFGKGGVLFLGAPDDFVSARLDVDRDGAIYTFVAGHAQRIAHGKRAPMCGEGFVAASPRSDHVWRWFALTKITRSDGMCTDEGSIDASDGDAFGGSVWVVGDGLVVERGNHDLVLDGDGQASGELAGAGDLVRADACGSSICASQLSGIVVYGPDRTQVGAIDYSDLIGTHRSWMAHGFAARGGSAYVLGLEYREGSDDGQPVIVRVDGLPR
jgi:hypothetical protein